MGSGTGPHPEEVPPDVLTGVPLDCVGVDDGACRLLELLEELLELELPDEPELPDEVLPVEELPEEEPLDAFEPPDERECLVDACEPPDDFELPDEACWVEVLVLVEAWVAPGSSTVTTPAATTLAAERAAVVRFSLRRPRSRSATARDTVDSPVRNCRVSIPKSLTHQLVRAVRPRSEVPMILPASMFAGGRDHRDRHARRMPPTGPGGMAKPRAELPSWPDERRCFDRRVPRGA